MTLVVILYAICIGMIVCAVYCIKILLEKNKTIKDNTNDVEN